MTTYLIRSTGNGKIHIAKDQIGPSGAPLWRAHCGMESDTRLLIEHEPYENVCLACERERT